MKCYASYDSIERLPRCTAVSASTDLSYERNQGFRAAGYKKCTNAGFVNKTLCEDSHQRCARVCEKSGVPKRFGKAWYNAHKHVKRTHASGLPWKQAHVVEVDPAISIHVVVFNFKFAAERFLSFP